MVTSATNGASEILAAGVHGSVVPAPIHPGDLAREVSFWLNRQDREAISAATRARALDFPAEDRCTEILELYRELIAVRTPSTRLPEAWSDP